MRGGNSLGAILAATCAMIPGVVVVAPPARGQGKPGRVYGAENIKRHLQRQKRTWGASGSLAGEPHEHKREIARRLRQAERDEANRRSRYFARYGHAPGVSPGGVVLGLSRRGRAVVV